MKHFLLLLSCLFISGSIFSQPFNPQNSGTTETLGGIDFVDENYGFSVGNMGTILKTEDGGQRWIQKTSGVSVTLTDVAFVDYSTGYVTGRNGIILKTTNGGDNWQPLNTGLQTDLTNIFIGTNAIYVSGYFGTVLKSSDGGENWNQLVTGTSDYLYGIYFLDESTGFFGSFPGGGIFKTVDAGESWTRLSVSTQVSHILGFYFTSENTGFAVGGTTSFPYDGVILKTTDAGANWTTTNFDENYIGNVSFLNDTIGFAAGGSIPGNTSEILKTLDGGETWEVASSNSNRQFGLAIPNGKAGYTSGLNGTILKTIDILEVNNYNITIEDSICEGSSYLFGNDEITEEGEYTNTYTSQGGGDSLVTLTLTVLKSDSVFLTEVLCGGESYVFNEEEIDESGDYQATYSNQYGCDSIVFLNLTITDLSIAVTQNSDTLFANENDAEYSWINCDNPANGILSTSQQFIPEVDGNFAVIIEKNNCTDTSSCYEVNTTGITTTDPLNYTLFPNPTNGKVFISFDQILAHVEVSLLSTLGQELTNLTYKGVDQIEFNIQAPKGVCIVEIRSQYGIKRFTIFKE